MTKNKPAFPVPFDQGESWQGMTIRDYFAAEAMKALITTADYPSQNLESVVYDAIRYADELIEQLSEDSE